VEELECQVLCGSGCLLGSAGRWEKDLESARVKRVNAAEKVLESCGECKGKSKSSGERVSAEVIRGVCRHVRW